jgi:uncharacterized protein YdhG (YjbR/CyaY superfamily)
MELEMPKGKSSAKKSSKSTKGFSDWEKAAMKERAAELKAQARAGKDREAGEKAVQEAIKVMKEPDRTIAKRIHEIVKSTAPDLMPKTWYGMPAYANDDGKVVCFFQSGHKYGSRYSTFGFQDAAKLDEGAMWPASFALTKLTASDEAKIVTLVKKAVS